MVVEPDSNGTEMTRMGLKWDSNDSHKTQMRLKRGEIIFGKYGTRVGLK